LRILFVTLFFMFLNQTYAMIKKKNDLLGAMLILLCFCFISNLTAQTPYATPKKKIIEFGWDIPNYDFVADNITAMEYAPFDGVVFDMRIPKRQNVRRSWSVCNPDEVKESDFDFTKLAKISSNKFTDNFIRVFMQDDYDQVKFGWFNDTIWTNIKKTTKLLSKAVKVSKSKGIFLDTEEYSGLQNPWEYSTTIYPNQTSQQVYDKVRQRGREYMIELQSDMPNVKVMYSFAYDFIENWGNGSYYAQKYALLKPFLDGMLEAAGPQVILIDGNEATYFTDKNEDYTWWYDQVKIQYIKDRIPTELIAKYKSQYRAAYSPIVNRYFDIPYGQAGYDFNFDLPLATQKKWLEHGIFNRLMNSDEYVWTWSQGDVNWWNGSNFKNKQEWIDATVAAKAKLSNGQALGYTMSYAGNELKADLSYSAVTATMTYPAHNAVIPVGEVTFKVQFNDATKNNYQYFYVNGLSKGYTLNDTAKIKLTAGIYTAYVFGYDKDNKSYQSNPVTFTVGNPSTADTQAPTVPTNLSAANITTTSFTVNWTAATDNIAVSSYDIFSNGNFVANTANLTYNFTNQTPNTTYSITLKAKDAAGNISAASAALSVKTAQATDTQAPTVPTNLSAANITTTSFTVNWTAATDNIAVSSYDVFSNGNFVANTASLTYNFTNQTPNTAYSITLKAKDAAGNISAASAALSVKTLQATTNGDTQAPTPPTYVAPSTITETSFILIWSGATDNVGVVSYDIFLNGTLKQSTNLTYFTLTGLNKATNYGVTIKAKDAAGNISLSSAAITVTTVGTATNTDTQAPSSPSNVVASNITTTSFSISWLAAKDNIGVKEYEVLINDVPYGKTPNTTLAITGKQANSAYYVTVRAYDAAGNKSSSVGISVQTLANSQDTQAPTAPTAVKATNILQNAIYINWLGSSDNVAVTGYEVFVNGASVGKTSIYAPNFNINNLLASTTYNISVKAFDAAGNVSAASQVLIAKTLNTPDYQAPTTPKELKANNITSNSFTLSWAAATDNIGVVKYLIYQDYKLLMQVAGNVTSQSITNLSSNTFYNMSVKAVDAAGNQSSLATALTVKTVAVVVRATLPAATIAPNPIKDFATLTFNQTTAASAILILRDLNGKILLSKNINAIAGVNTLSFDATSIPSGIYLLQILRTERNESLRIVVQH
jgi:chitodextrinase